MKKFRKSQQDPNPSRRVNPGLEKGYRAKRVDLGWLLQSCKCLLQIDCTRVDPLRRVEAYPGSCKGGLRAYSHDPRTVNYPGVSVTSRSHDDFLSRQLHCPRASSSSSDHYEFI